MYKPVTDFLHLTFSPLLMYFWQHDRTTVFHFQFFCLFLLTVLLRCHTIVIFKQFVEIGLVCVATCLSDIHDLPVTLL